MFKRLSRLFQVDVHAVLDQLEDPESLLKQSLREMAAEIHQLEQQLHQQQAEHTRLSQQLAKCQQRQHDIEPQLDLCFKANNEELARSLVQQRLQWQKLHDHLQQNLNSSQEHQHNTRKQLQHFQQQYEELLQKADVFLASANTHDASTYRSGHAECDLASSRAFVNEHELEIAWLQEKAKRETTSPASNSKKGGGHE